MFAVQTDFRTQKEGYISVILVADTFLYIVVWKLVDSQLYLRKQETQQNQMRISS